MKTKLINIIESRHTRSQWDKAVKLYAIEIVESIAEGVEYEKRELTLEDINLERALNGASNWTHYSDSGLSLCYTYDIAKRLMTPSQFKKWEATTSSSWDDLGTQSRALSQAWNLVTRAARQLKNA